MILNISIDTDSSFVSKLAEEAESNESSFIQELCSDFLQQISKQTQKLEQTLKEINLANPFGFPTT